MKKRIQTAALAAILAGSAAWSVSSLTEASAVDDALARAWGTFTPAKPVEPQKRDGQKHDAQERVQPQEEQKPVQETQPKDVHEQEQEQKSVREERQAQPPVSAVAEQSPDFAAIQRGIASYRKGDLDAAYQEFSKAIELNGENPTAFVNRGIVLREMKRYEDSQQDLRTAQSFDPKNALIAFEMGLTSIAQNDGGAALAHLNQAVALQPNDLGTQLYRASLLYRLGRFDDAIVDYTRVLEKADDTLKPRAYIERGLVKEQKQELASAVEDYTSALAIEKDNVPALSRRGACLEQMGRQEEAIADFSHLLEVIPAENASLVYFNRAACYRRLQRLDEAVADYTRALDHTAAVLPIYIERAISYRLMGRNEEALLDIERALAIEPKNPDLLNLRAIEKVKLSDIEGALADLNAAISLHPKNAAFLGNRAGILENMGEKAKAIDDYTAALLLEPQNANFYYRRGYLYRLSGKMAESEKDYKAATALQPNLPAYE